MTSEEAVRKGEGGEILAYSDVYIISYIGEMYSRFWNGLPAGFRRFWKQRLPIEMFRIEAYMTVVGLPSALKK